MNNKDLLSFLNRIDALSEKHKPLFGTLNVNQMICHCADFFRLAKGEKLAEEYGKLSAEEVTKMVEEGKTAPSPKGFNQVAGDGTKPTTIENDKKILKQYLLEFSNFPVNYLFAKHPYFGEMDSERWNGLAEYHLNHHLTQFGV